MGTTIQARRNPVTGIIVVRSSDSSSNTEDVDCHCRTPLEIWYILAQVNAIVNNLTTAFCL